MQKDLSLEEQTNLYQKNKKKIEMLVASRSRKNFGVPGFEHEDYQQEARLAAWKALRKYDSTRGELEPFVMKSIIKAQGTLISKSFRQKRLIVKEWLLFGNNCKLSDRLFGNEIAAFENVFIPRDQIRKIQKATSKTKNDLEKAVVDCYLSTPEALLQKGQYDLSQRAVAEYLNISPYKLKKIMKNIRAKIEDSKTEV